MYSLYILKNGAEGKKRSREIGIATTNKDESLTLHFDVPVPTDAQGEPVKVFLRVIERKQEAA
jgi:hypothetical protein